MTSSPPDLPYPDAILHGEHMRVRGGRVPGLEDAPAYSFVAPRRMRLPVLVAVPHAGRDYPAQVVTRMRDPQEAQLRLEDRLVDRLGIAIAEATGASLLVAHAPRALLDLNRAEDDVDWDMIEGGKPELSDLPKTGVQGCNRRARSGLGLVPRRLPGTGEIWRGRLGRSELAARIAGIHQAYHGFLAAELERIRRTWGAALLVDLHSMPPLRAADDEARAPQIVLGDRFGASCHHGLMSAALRHLDARGCLAAQNRPYSGGYVLDRHGAPQLGIHALQVEVCRTTYLDVRLAEPGEGLAAMAELLATLVSALGSETALMGDSDNLLQAAE
ncbi:N-formylglutamate amidohydrolase [Erythrobacter dokdonensis]|uniref:N-formylglutamate amidohydrolase n=2 Tax=Erythrobacter TaxID=1041 RepID=A0A1A7BGJ8_9SPHN|nr:N-formylglutamate amidohydrolase [Erythrobacter dokdonensis]OBV11673.1 N-formylglutamate amidohydrolase [Erythrobacter dokdonensis DSW-74]